MFLKPIAKPTPRWTPSPRVVLPAPPGSRTARAGAAPAPAGAGRGTRRITSATGNEPVTSCPVGSVPPGRERIQQPQLDRVDVERLGELSICASAAKQVCTAPKPRIAPHGGLFV